MQSQPSSGVVIAVAVGGSLVVLAICTFSIRLVLRAKHKRKMARISTEIEGRLSQISSTLMHISDDDVARMPGTNLSAQRPLHGYYSRSPYTPMSSRETLESHPALKSLEKVKSMDRSNHEAVITQPWPLPRRLTRSDGTPLANVPTPSNLPKKRQGSKSEAAVEPVEKIIRSSKENGDRSNFSGVAQNKSEILATELKPKPLFHDHKRSISSTRYPEMIQNTPILLPVANAKAVSVSNTPRSKKPRSFSVCSQEPGAPPTHVLPPLPFEASSKVKGAMSPTDFSTCGSLFSDSTSILNDIESKILSSTEAPAISIDTANGSSQTTEAIANPQGLGLWDSAESLEKASPITAGKASRLRPQISAQKSFRGSIQYSSGVPPSILDHASYAGSNINTPEVKSPCEPKPKSPSPSKEDANSANEDISQKFSVNDKDPSKAQWDTTSKRAVNPPLSRVSGNRGNPAPASHCNPALSSTINDEVSASSQPPGMSGKSIENKDQQRRPSRLRKSKIPISTPKPRQSTTSAQQKQLTQTKPSVDPIIRHPSRKDDATQLPSRPTLDIQPRPSRRRAPTTLQVAASSSTRTTMSSTDRSNRSANSSPEPEISTPTKKPARRPTPGNRLSSAFDSPFTSTWHTPLPSNVTTTESEPSTVDQDSRPPSFLFNFPNPPPKPVNNPLWRAPKTPIRGPRSPLRKHSKTFSSRSPSRSPSRRSSPLKGSPSSVRKSERASAASLDLRRSIMSLRRQNSEVNSPGSRGSRGHKRYLSIGDDDTNRDSGIFDDNGDRKEGKESSKDDGEEWKESDGAEKKTTAPFHWELSKAGMNESEDESGRNARDSTMSFYDGDGFLRGE
ncbi:hypothetical protein ACLMJK_001438 [Lecanora helva]